MSKASARSIAVGVVALLLLLTWGQAEAQVPAASAEVARVAGQVSVLPKGQQTWVPATVGARLVQGDQIRALAASSADLNLPDGSTILVAENTRFAVTKLEYDPRTRDRNAAFYLVAGKVRAQISATAVQLARARQSNFTISTPSGVAAVRGTIVVVAHNSRTGETIIFALPSPGQLPGAARVTYVSRSGEQVTIVGGQFTRQSGTGAPSAPTPISNLTPAAQATILGAGNASTANEPDLTGFNVTIIPSNLDITLVQMATGAPADGGGGTVPTGLTTSIGSVGRDILSNQGSCVQSSGTTCP
jgi:hypothetical protein